MSATRKLLICFVVLTISLAIVIFGSAATPQKLSSVAPTPEQEKLPDKDFTYLPEKPHDPATPYFKLDQWEHSYRVPGEIRLEPLLSQSADTQRAQEIEGLTCKECSSAGGNCDPLSRLCTLRSYIELQVAKKDSVQGIFHFGGFKLFFTSRVTADRSGYRLSYFSLSSSSGQFKITAYPSINKQQEARVEIQKEKVVVSSDKRDKQTVVIRGDKSVLIKMVDQSIDVLVLPLLSYTLGKEQGITGRDYPASMPIHRLAMASARSRPVRVRTRDAVGVMAMAKFAETHPPDCGIYAPNPKRCYGMCGDDCQCWPWVCGDCCCHEGCREHDEVCHPCANCPSSNLISCARCYTIDALYAKINCHSCLTPRVAPSCPSSAPDPIPQCGPGERYCPRLSRCAKKTECPRCGSSTQCGHGEVCYQGRCWQA